MSPLLDHDGSELGELVRRTGSGRSDPGERRLLVLRVTELLRDRVVEGEHLALRADDGLEELDEPGVRFTIVHRHRRPTDEPTRQCEREGDGESSDEPDPGGDEHQQGDPERAPTRIPLDRR